MLHHLTGHHSERELLTEEAECQLERSCPIKFWSTYLCLKPLKPEGISRGGGGGGRGQEAWIIRAAKLQNRHPANGHCNTSALYFITLATSTEPGAIH